jgi:uncharacterized membrane-anchored protein
MKTNKWIWIAFGALVVVQWYASLSMVFVKEDLLKTGVAFKFRTAPIDPSDPFRGKYVVLNYEIREAETKHSALFQQNKNAYVLLDTDDLGYASVKAISPEPFLNPNHVQVEVSYVDSNIVHFRLPFNRFYMEEGKATAAEQVYGEVQRDSAQLAYAVVYVKDGEALVENVFINEVPIKEAAEKWKRENGVVE